MLYYAFGQVSKGKVRVGLALIGSFMIHCITLLINVMMAYMPYQNSMKFFIGPDIFYQNQFHQMKMSANSFPTK